MAFRNRHAVSLFVSFTLVSAMILVAGCGKKPKPTTEVVKEPASQEAQPSQPPEQPKPPAVEAAAEVTLDDVFFDFDKYNLREDARQTMERNAGVLSKNAGARALLEGHCDERGTVEYNLALGDRRAQSVKNYLAQFGIDNSRLLTISYGEERPFAAGHDEAAWAQNRRVHFVIQK